jgi:hypothetical protein
MNTQFYRLQEGDLRRMSRSSRLDEEPTLLPSLFWHIYIKLDFQKQYENAETKADGHAFVVSVARAAAAAELVLRGADGIVVEVQESVIHCLIHDVHKNPEAMRRQCSAIHRALEFVFSGGSKVEGWRMTADWGKTLLVRGRGIHNDDSYVSLGNAANAPAKHLYSELSVPSEVDRRLKRYMLGVRDAESNNWRHESLTVLLSEGFTKIASAELTEAKTREFHVTNMLTKEARAVRDFDSGQSLVHLRANDMVETNEAPVAFFGWVMRADLDGFTARVENCFDDDDELLVLGKKFQDIMDEGARFAGLHSELLVQLPWAGDNFTAAVTFADRDAYHFAIDRRYVEFSLDFANELKSVTANAGLQGWAQTSAGGDVHGNAHGNIYVGSVSFENRRFLIGAGVGFGRTSQAFSDMKPKSGELVIFDDDYSSLLKPYQNQFVGRTRHDGAVSTLFRKAIMADLTEARIQIDRSLSSVAQPVKTSVTIGGGLTAKVSSRPYAIFESEL